MKKIIIIFIAIAEIGIGTAIGDGIDAGVLVRSGGRYGINESLNNEPRPGVDVDEINLMSIDSTVTAVIANKMNVSLPIQVGTGLYNGNWVSLTNLFTTVGISDQTTKDAFTKWFINGDAKKDAESYWGDTNTNNAIEPNEWYHRFNLARTDWNTLTVDDILAPPVAYDPNAVTHNGGGLRWLANFGKNASGGEVESLRGTFPTVLARRKQIIANLIDYCDGVADGVDKDFAKHEVTRDDDNDPTYTGNESTPYINEIGIKVQCTPTITKSGSGYRNDYNFSTAVYFEIANVYGAGVNLNSATTCEILEGTVFYTRQESDGTLIVDEYYSLAQGAKTITSVSTLGYRSTAIGAFGTPVTGTYYDNQNHDAAVTNVYVQIKRVRLMYDVYKKPPSNTPKFADFAKPDYDGGFSTAIPTLVTKTGGGSGGGVARSVCFSYQVNDPRQNLNDGDWPQATSSHPLPLVTPYTVASTAVYGMKPTPATGNTVGTPAVVNDVVTFATDGDMESTLTPTTLSTAYIRNAPMASPWELGAIHRGAAWETINLKEYNAVAGANPLTGGGLYKESATGSKDGGDANILDQIKMTDKVKNKQKVNLNLKNDDTEVVGGVTVGRGILSALFKKIKVGSSYANTVRLFNSSNAVANFSASGVGDRWINSSTGNLYTWDGSGWTTTTKNAGDSYISAAVGTVRFWTGSAWSTWSDAAAAEISPADVIAIVNDIKANSSTFKTRASVANVAALKNTSLQPVSASDRVKEEIIGKTVNLTTVAPSGYFTIIIIAQSIKDIGGGVTINKDINGDNAIGTASEGGVIDFDGNQVKTDNISETIGSCQYGVYNPFADEIMSEQKIRADVYRDPQTGKYTIIRMEYVEE